LVDAGFDGSIHLCRYLCRSCKRTASLLPEFALPYLRFSVSILSRFLIARRLQGVVLAAAAVAASQPAMPYQHGQFWIRRFQRQAAALCAAGTTASALHDRRISAGLLMRVDLEDDAEKAAYVDLAAELEDGEAMTIAIAAVRGFAVATDDRKARRIAAQRYGNSLVLVRTTEILRAWVLDACVDDATVRTVLNRIETIARFRPANDDPLRDWWDQAVSSRLD
jgi:hypothetical protein